MRYIIDHWHGRYSVSWSFWINLVAIRLLLMLLQPMFQNPALPYSTSTTVVTISFVVLANFVLFGWQIVGLLRACDKHLKAFGSMAVVWGVQIGLIFFAWHAILSVLDGWYSLLPESEIFAERMAREHSAKYQLSVSGDGSNFEFDGIIALGATKKLSAMIENYPDASTIVLNSKGGNIFEARGMAQLLQANRIKTLVERECSSACTTVFIGGEYRTIHNNAKIGFHQYRLDADYAVLNFDVAREQEKDRAYFKSRSVSQYFLDQIYNFSSNQIWYPTPDRLLKAGVVHKIVVPKTDRHQ